MGELAEEFRESVVLALAADAAEFACEVQAFYVYGLETAASQFLADGGN